MSNSSEQVISKSLAINLKNINEILNIDKNFDIIYRVFEVAEREACLYFIDGLNKDEILEKLMEKFHAIKKEDMPDNAHEFSKLVLPYGEVDLMRDMDQLITMLLVGVPMLVIDGYEQILAIDFRTYPQRSVEEPEKDKVLRGSRDGFVETVVFNTALIRRRIRDPQLTMEITSVGKASKTDIVLCYMNNRVNQKFLNEIRDKLSNIKVDALSMNTESLAECIYKRNWINPFPKFKYTERPDTAAASILEGNIVVIIDNSPSAMILPTTLFEITEEADDYYFPPVTGTYLRITRLLINIIALFLTPVWLLLMENPDWIPTGLEFLRIKDPINIPIVVQLLILEFAIDGLKLASLNTPSMLSTPLSVVAGIVLGDFTVSSGWFNAETMLYMAFVAIANYSQASYELGYALKFLRLIMVVLTGILGGWGFLIGFMITIWAVVSNKTISGEGYLYPLFPFNGKELVRRFLRISITRANNDMHN